MSRAGTALICRVLIGVFVFAQIAVSAYACPGGSVSLGGVTEMIAQDMPGCDEMAQPDQQAPNLCIEHCKVGQQTNDTNATPVVMAPVSALLYVLWTPATVHEGEGRVASSVDPLLAAAPPPHAILHCVLRI